MADSMKYIITSIGCLLLISSALMVSPAQAAEGDPQLLCMAEWSKAFDAIDRYVIREVEGSSAELLSDNTIRPSQMPPLVRFQTERYQCMSQAVCRYLEQIGTESGNLLQSQIAPMSHTGGAVPSERSTCPAEMLYQDLFDTLEIDATTFGNACNQFGQDTKVLIDICYQHAQLQTDIYHHSLVQAIESDSMRRTQGFFYREVMAMQQRLSVLQDLTNQWIGLTNGVFARACTYLNNDRSN